MKIRRCSVMTLQILLLFGICPSIQPFLNGADTGQSTPALANSSDEKAAAEEQKKKDLAEELELLTLFADTLDQISRNYVKDVSRRELMEAAIEGMVSKLDQYSNYIPPEQIERFKGSVESQFGGIGIQVSVEEKELKVISPIVGSPAYRAGMIAGDVITKIAGKSAIGITIDEAVRRMKGKNGTKVKVTVRHPNDKIETFEITREIIRLQTVMGDLRKENDNWNFFYNDEKKIGYLRLTAFGRHTTDELRKALTQLSDNDMKGLILDLRYNPGGLLSAAIDICDMFISKGTIVSTEGRNTQKRVWHAHQRGSLDGFPMAVLVNRYSASASEIVSACLQDHKRAVIIGERTWGKGSVQNIIELENGRSALKLTTAGYLRPSGKNIHRFRNAKEEDVWGVTPNEGYSIKLSHRESAQYQKYRHNRDIVHSKAAPAEEEAKFEDRQLTKALEYIQEQLNPEQPAGQIAKEKPKPLKAEKKVANKPVKKTDNKPEKGSDK